MSALKSKYPDLDPAKLFASNSGDLFVEGTKVVMVGAEEHHIYVSGLVRRVDIADAGSCRRRRRDRVHRPRRHQRTLRRGWLGRTLGKPWPF